MAQLGRDARFHSDWAAGQHQLPVEGSKHSTELKLSQAALSTTELIGAAQLTETPTIEGLRWISIHASLCLSAPSKPPET